jgi:hypothetical protein
MTRRRAIALHEAAHAVAAKLMGLTVAWVSIDSGHEEGLHFTAATKIPDETLDFDQDRHAVLVAMSAPSHMTTFDKDIDAYARAEEQLAYKVASLHGLEPGDIYDDASNLVDGHKAEIVDLAERLVAEGKVVFATA